MTKQTLILDSRVRFEAKFTVGAKALEPREPTATVTQAGVAKVYTKNDGLKKSGDGIWYVDVNINRPGPLFVKFHDGDGVDHEQQFMVEQKKNAETAQSAAPRSIAWPRGYDRDTAIAALRLDSSKSDAYIYGMLTQHLATTRLNDLMRHDDKDRLPQYDDEILARRLASSRLPGNDSIEQARRDIRGDILAGRR